MSKIARARSNVTLANLQTIHEGVNSVKVMWYEAKKPFLHDSSMKTIAFILHLAFFMLLAAPLAGFADPTTRSPSIQRYVSINDSGQVAYVGSYQGADNLYTFQASTPGQLNVLMNPGFEIPDQGISFPSQEITGPMINNASVVVAWRFTGALVEVGELGFGPTEGVACEYIEEWPFTGTPAPSDGLPITDIAMGNGGVSAAYSAGDLFWLNPVGGDQVPSPYVASSPWVIVFGPGNSYPAINNGGVVAFCGIPNGSGGYYLTSSSAQGTAQSYNLPTSTLPYPRISDSGSVVATIANGTSKTLQLFPNPADLTTTTTLISAANGFSEIGMRPCINSAGTIIAFCGDFEGTNALLGTGPGIFALLSTNNTGWTLVRVASVPDDSYIDSNIGVNNVGQIVYKAKNTDGSLGLFTTDVSQSTNSQTNASTIIASTGNDLRNGFTSDLEFYDGLNNFGQVAYWIQTSSGAKIIVQNLPPLPSVQLMDIEVVQAIQDWYDSIPLVANKLTLVRVYLELPQGAESPVTINGAKLTVISNGSKTELTPINPGGEIVVTNYNASLERGQLSQSLNFELPLNLCVGNNVSLEFKWTDGSVVDDEPVYQTGNQAGNEAVNVSFTTVPPIQVKYIFTSWTDTDGITHGPMTSSASELNDRLSSIYPVPSLSGPPLVGTYTWMANPPTTIDDNDKSHLDTLIKQIQKMRNVEIGRNSPIHYYGVVSDIDLGGLGYANDDFATSILASSVGSLPSMPWVYGRNRHAHEIGHNLGRRHAVYKTGTPAPPNQQTEQELGDWGETAPLGAPYFPFMSSATDFEQAGAGSDVLSTIGGNETPTLGPLAQDSNPEIYGWDSHSESVISPLNNYELMGYADRMHSRWISSYTYINLMNAITARFGTPPQTQVGGNYLLVSGSIDLNADIATFDPIYPTSTAVPATNSTSDYAMQIFDSHQSLLLTIPFLPAIPHPDWPAPDTGTNGQFFVWVPFVPDIHSIKVLHGTKVIGSVTAPSHSPMIQLNYPKGGETFSNQAFNVEWTASDVDSNALSYEVEFSPNGGTNWQVLTIDWPTNSYPVNPANLAGTTNGVIRVIASDGFNSSFAQSRPFTVATQPPSVIIEQPGNNSVFTANQEIHFIAEASDLQDGQLSGTNLIWNSSVNGFLGVGPDLVLLPANLKEGMHFITATAIDSKGLTSSSSINISVAHNLPPTVYIQNINGQNMLLWPISVTNYLLTSCTNLSANVWTVVTNLPTSYGAMQSVPLNAMSGSQFFRLELQ